MKWAAIILQSTGWDFNIDDWDDALRYERKEFDTRHEAENWAEEYIYVRDTETMDGTPIHWNYRILPPDYDGTW